MPANRDLAVMPDSPLAQLLAQLKRGDRRLLLATIQAGGTPRRTKLQRQMHARLRALGLEK